MGIPKETLKCFAVRKSYSSQSRAHLAVSTEQVSSQTNKSCLCKSSWPFTISLYGSQYDHVIHVALITIPCVSLITSFQPPLHVCNNDFLCINACTYLGWAWASPTLAWLHWAHVCIYACLDQPLTVDFKSAHSNISRWLMVHADVYFSYTSRENKCEGLLPACRVGVKESESEDYSSWMHWQCARQLTFWTMIWVWRSRDRRTVGCTLASGTRLAWPLIHSMDSLASLWFDCEA